MHGIAGTGFIRAGVTVVYSVVMSGIQRSLAAHGGISVPVASRLLGSHGPVCHSQYNSSLLFDGCEFDVHGR